MVKQIAATIANGFLYMLFYSTWLNYWKKSKHLDSIQSNYLLELVKKNATTKFGKHHDFSTIHSVRDFQKSVPISNYEYYTTYIDAIKNGEKDILTSDDIVKFSLSSGTATASKQIPTNKTLIQEFDNCISVWLFDLYNTFPSLLHGKAFWIITPSTKTTQKNEQITSGFENDSDYFSPLKQWLIRTIFTVPDEVAQFCEGENYFFVLATFIMSDKNLRLISVWNPSIVLILLEKAAHYQKQIIESIETGTLLLPEPMKVEHTRILEKKLHKNPKRAKELKLLCNSLHEKAELWSAIWPRLTLISAWNSAWAIAPAIQLEKLFPKATFQGKGLLATEACITFPIEDSTGKSDYLPAFTSHFFEFEHTLTKEIKLLNEVEKGGTYEVIVTTGGGLYRYRLHDIVLCYGFLRGMPLLNFEGKSNLISDIAGEKLHENHVAHVLQTVFEELKIESSFYFLAPQLTANSCQYILFIYTNKAFNLNQLREKIELGLCENFHYKHCRTLEQLKALQIQLLQENSRSHFYEIIQSTGSLGSSKQTALRKETFWKEKLIES